MAISRDPDGGLEHIDWAAAWDAIVADLRPRRYVRVARAATQALVALAVMASALWLLIALVAEPFTQLGRPWL